jgi:elongation factor P
MYTASDLRRGLRIELDGEPYIITDFQFSKPGKGQALYRCRLKSLVTGLVVDRTYRSADKFKPAELEEHTMQFLYRQGNDFHFMNMQTYEQSLLTADQVGDAAAFMTESMEVRVLYFQGQPIGVTPPTFVELKVTMALPGLKGDSVSGATKPVTLESGHTVQVPLFIKEGDVLKIDTRTGEYIERV